MSSFSPRKVQSQKLYLYCSTGMIWSLKPNSTVVPNSYIHWVNSWGDPADPSRDLCTSLRCILRLSMHRRKKLPVVLTLCLQISVPLQKNTWNKHTEQPRVLPEQNSCWVVKGRMRSVGSFHESMDTWRETWCHHSSCMMSAISDKMRHNHSPVNCYSFS